MPNIEREHRDEKFPDWLNIVAEIANAEFAKTDNSTQTGILSREYRPIVNLFIRKYYLKIEAHLKNLGFSTTDRDNDQKEILYLEGQEASVVLEKNYIYINWVHPDNTNTLLLQEIFTLRRDGKAMLTRNTFILPDEIDKTVIVDSDSQEYGENWAGDILNPNMLCEGIYALNQALLKAALSNKRGEAFSRAFFASKKEKRESQRLFPKREIGLTDKQYADFVANKFLVGEDEWTDRLYKVLKRAFEIKRSTNGDSKLNPEDQNYLLEVEANMNNKFPEGQEIVWAAFELVHERATKQQDITTIDDL